MPSRTCEALSRSAKNEHHHCSRTVSNNFLFCWPQIDQGRAAAESLNSNGALLQSAMLQHLTDGPDKDFEDFLVSTYSTPKSTSVVENVEDQASGGPSLGALELPLEILHMILSELTFPDLEPFNSVNTRAQSSESHFPKQSCRKARLKTMTSSGAFISQIQRHYHPRSISRNSTPPDRSRYRTLHLSHPRCPDSIPLCHLRSLWRLCLSPKPPTLLSPLCRTRPRIPVHKARRGNRRLWNHR